MSAFVGHDVEVAREHHGLARACQLVGVRDHAFEPGELVVEVGARHRIAVRQVHRRHHDAADLHFEIARLHVLVVAG
jgi:hypothetical protein